MKEEPFVKNKDSTPKMILGTSVIKSDISRPDPGDYAGELGLPVDAPRALSGGTMERFLRWHGKNV